MLAPRKKIRIMHESSTQHVNWSIMKKVKKRIWTIDRSPVMLRLPEPLAKKIEKLATKKKMSKNAIVGEIVAEYFNSEEDRKDLA